MCVQTSRIWEHRHVGLSCVCVPAWHVRVAGGGRSGKPVCPGESGGLRSKAARIV